VATKIGNIIFEFYRIAKITTPSNVKKNVIANYFIKLFNIQSENIEILSIQSTNY